MRTPLKNITQPSSSTLLIRGGNQNPLGFLFILFGLGAVAIGLQIIPVDNADEVGPLGFAAFVLFGLIFAGVGAYTALWSSLSVIDKSRGSLTYRAGLFGLGKNQSVPLTNFSAVELGFTEGDSDTSDQYPIHLVGEHNKQSPLLHTFYNVKEADQCTKLIAEFLGWPVKDRTLGETAHIVQPHAKTNFTRTKPNPPAPTQLEIKDTIGEIDITFPAPNMVGSSIFSALAPLLFLTFILWDTLVKTPEYGMMMLGLAIGIIFIVVKWHARHRRKITLHVGSKELNITGDIMLPRKFKIDVNDIRSLSLHAQPSENNSPRKSPMAHWNNNIVVQTADERYKIARGLSANDTTYIYEVLKTYV